MLCEFLTIKFGPPLLKTLEETCHKKGKKWKNKKNKIKNINKDHNQKSVLKGLVNLNKNFMHYFMVPKVHEYKIDPI